MRENEDLELFPFEILLPKDMSTWELTDKDQKDIGRMVVRSPYMDDFRRIITTRKEAEYFKYRDSLYYLTEELHSWLVQSDVVYSVFLGNGNFDKISVKIVILGSNRATLFKMAWI